MGAVLPGARARIVDVIERALVLALYAWLVARIILATTKGGAALASVLILPSEGLVLAFVLMRRPAETLSIQPRDWLFAALATGAPMLVAPSVRSPLAPPLLAATLLVLGIVVQVHAKLALGRSFGCIPAHRGLRLGGPYRVVRHPMYAGYMLTHLGFLLLQPSWRNALLYALADALQIPRLLAEERVLASDDAYHAYRRKVRWRLVPRLF